jgi:hypothetical protein
MIEFSEKPLEGMRYFFIHLHRPRFDSCLTLVAATTADPPKKAIKQLLEIKFPGWVTKLEETNQRVFEARCLETAQLQLIDWDRPVGGITLTKMRLMRGNFFDPAWF